MSTSLAFHPRENFAAVQAATSLLSRSTPAFPDRAGPHVPQGLPARHFTQDSKIFAEGDAAAHFYRVASGVVRTCKFFSDGRRQIDAFYIADDVFGLEAGTQYGLSAEAVSDCSVIPYRRRGLETMATQDNGMALQLYSYAMRYLEHTRAHSLLLGRGTALQKLATFLLQMARDRPATDVVDLAMTRQDIADYLGLTIETVSRTLTLFERQGVIALSTARRICLKDRACLQRYNV